MQGSSPLARGLRQWIGTENVPRTDHPRSRGVYDILEMQTQGKIGSSPLARGLPVNGLLRRDGRRIIPARAGFTQASDATNMTNRDHPRSRGVYARR